MHGRRSWRLRRVAWLGLLVVAGLIGVSMGALHTAASKPNVAGRSGDNEKQVRICHRTASTKNPYVVNTPAIANNGDLKGGHLDHIGPVYSPGISGKWGDIIPPYTYLDKNGVQQTFPGYNWDEAGQAIWQGGCSLGPGPSLPVVPLLKCVEPGPGAGFLAHFGYANPNSTATEIPLGDDNFIQPSSANGGQPTTFAPGQVDDAFQVQSNGGDITWNLLGNDVTASANSTPCRAAITVVKVLEPSDDDGPVRRSRSTERPKAARCRWETAAPPARSVSTRAPTPSASPARALRASTTTTRRSTA